jgi:hypothetical protein
MLFTLTTGTVAVFSRLTGWRLLWIPFILAGVCQFNLNWTTGQLGFVPLAVQVFGAHWVRAGLVGPIIISFGIPLGAILFWMHRGKWLEKIDELAMRS